MILFLFKRLVGDTANVIGFNYFYVGGFTLSGFAWSCSEFSASVVGLLAELLMPVIAGFTGP